MLNICIINPEKNAYSETFVRAHIERLPGKVSFLYGGSFPHFKANGEPLLPQPSFLKRVCRSLLSRLFKFNFDEDILRKKALYEFLKDNQIDAVLTEYGPTGTRVMDVCQEAGVALIVHFHGYDAYEHQTLEKFGGAYRQMFQTADAFIAVSKHMVNKLVDLGAPQDKVFYNPCGMDSKIFYGSDPAKAAPVFLTTGRFVDKKAPHLVLLAFQKVLSQIPEAKLIMVGNGPLLDSSIAMAHALNISNAVEFAGSKSHQEVANLMRQVRAFVQHSITAASGDSEGTPVAIQEAGGSGLPVIATYHAGIPDVVQDSITGFLVKEGDIEGMAKRMIMIALDPSLAARIGAAAKTRILSQFTLDHSIQGLAKAIETTVNTKKGNS